MAINYKKIFKDILSEKYPEKLNDKKIIRKINNLNIYLDVINFNNHIFPISDEKTLKQNQQMKSYDPESIEKILAYQKKNNLSDSELANELKLSRNSISKWKKIQSL